MKLDIKELCKNFNFAAKNQSAFDYFYYDFFGKRAIDYCFLPRPALWLNKKSSTLAILRAGSPVIYFIWKYFAYLYFVKKLVFLLFKTKTSVVFGSGNKQLVLAVCKRSIEVVMQAAPIDEHTVWLAVPDCDGADKNKNLVSAVSLLTRKELIVSSLIACKVHFHLASESNMSRLFQTYAALDWVITFMALTKIGPTKIVTAEHHDRWAVLLDSYSKSVSTSGAQVELTLVQHGLEFSKTYEKIMELGFSDGLPYKLKHLAIIYTYDNNQLDVFKRFIICGQVAGPTLQSRLYKYKLPLSEVATTTKTLLIVGNALCEKFHLDLHLKLSKTFKLTCFYKPHPALRASPEIRSASWIFIEEKDYFPSVDLVISYPSTLANEYKDSNIIVLEHAFDASASDIEKITQVIADDLIWPIYK